MPRRRRTARRVVRPPLDDWTGFLGPGVASWCRCPRPDIGERRCVDFDGCFGRYEPAYWRDRAELLEAHEDGSGHAGTRPPPFWLYEAPALCSHRPRCEVGPVDSDGWPADARQAWWLAAHEVLSGPERRRIAADSGRFEGSALGERCVAMAAAVRDGAAARRGSS